MNVDTRRQVPRPVRVGDEHQPQTGRDENDKPSSQRRRRREQHPAQLLDPPPARESEGADGGDFHLFAHGSQLGSDDLPRGGITRVRRTAAASASSLRRASLLRGAILSRRGTSKNASACPIRTPPASLSEVPLEPPPPLASLLTLASWVVVVLGRTLYTPITTDALLRCRPLTVAKINVPRPRRPSKRRGRDTVQKRID